MFLNFHHRDEKISIKKYLTAPLSLLVVLAASLTVLPVISYAQAKPSKSSVAPAGGPILKIKPTAPSQWQSPITPQSNQSLPPVPASDNTLAKPQTEAQASSLTPTSALVIGTSSQRVPAGTFLNVRFNTAMDSKTTPAGEPFTAVIQEDFFAQQHVVLPVGTVIRGRVEQVQRPTFFSKGGALYLSFDHVVLPTGDIMPLDLKLSTQNTKVNKQGAIYQDPGITPKLGRSVGKGVGVFQKITKSGMDAGKQTADGLGTIVTVPLAVIGGALAGTAVTTGQSAVSIVGKGDSAIISPGDVARIDFGNSFNLPTE